MTRDITTRVATESEAAVVEPFLLAELLFEGDPVRVWNGVGDLEWDGKTWTGTGYLGGVDNIRETGSLESRGVSFTLSGIPSSLLSLALNADYHGRLAKLYKGFFRRAHETDQTVTTAADSTSNNNDGTLVNDPQWTADEVTDRIVGALSFDGVDQSVNLGNPSALDLETENAVTVEAWVRRDGSSEGTGIVTEHYAGTSVQYELGLQGSTSVFSKSGENPTFGFFDGSWHVVRAPSAIDQSVFVHLVGTYDGATLKIFVDGAEAASVSDAAGLPAATAQDFQIARRHDANGDEFFNGPITDLRIWNVARTQTEIQDNMNTRLNGDETGLVLYARLDDGLLSAGEILPDPFVIREGLMDQMIIKVEGDTARITVKAESRLASMFRAREFLYDHEDQQALYPGDKGFEFVPSLQDREITWGVGTGRPNAPRRIRDYRSGGAGGRGPI